MKFKEYKKIRLKKIVQIYYYEFMSPNYSKKDCELFKKKYKEYFEGAKKNE